MKQIYNFEQYNPPALNERIIREKIERRKLRWQTALIALAGILMQIIIAALGLGAVEEYPIITIFCCMYVLLSTTGGSILAVVYTQKGGMIS